MINYKSTQAQVNNGSQKLSPDRYFTLLFEEMYKVCVEKNWGDPFSYARSKEIYAATKLGHRVSPSLSGADAIGPNGEEYEYKSTTGKNCKGSYTGISVQPTWEEQEDYLRNDKIGKYTKHFFNRFKDGKLVESWEMDGEKVLEILLPKLERKYANTLNRKDPRLSASICWGEIKKYGRQVIRNGTKII